ncbi:Putative ribonuclease H protein At1g65750 [Linum perenne]
MGTNELWKTIWNWVGPSRIKHFLWISGHGRLLTNSERVRRHIASDSSCDRCGNPNESATHILRDCDFATDVWRRPEQGWATINTDGSVLRNPTRAAAGGIVRRDDGRSLGAFVANLGSCSVTRAELRGAVLGLEMAWALDCRRVELQLDSRAPVALLSRDGIQDHQHTLEVMAFQELCRREWVVSIRHVYREANRAADFLANRGHVFPYGVHHFPIVDCNLNYVLLYDSLGVSNPRLIAVND